MAPLKIGDVIEFRIMDGYAYGQYCLNHTDTPRYGQLLYIFEQKSPAQLSDLSVLEQSEIQFISFFPLAAAVRQKLVSVVGNIPVPPQRLALPTFRVGGMIDQSTKKAKSWSFWPSAERVALSLPLSVEHKHLPILGVANLDMLVQRIETGWKPCHDMTS
jgi:hypothetical protein